MTKNLNKQQLHILKAKIKGLAEGGTRCRKFINASTHDKRYRHWNEKRKVGLEARYHLIAYGLLRGIPYEQIEPNSTRFAYGDKDPMILYGNRLNYNYLAQICQHHCSYSDRGLWTPANIQRLINHGTMAIKAEVVGRVSA